MIDFKLLVADNYLENLDVIINNSLGFSHLSQFGSNKNMRPPCSAHVAMDVAHIGTLRGRDWQKIDL